jgi:hypothetical protein
MFARRSARWWRQLLLLTAAVIISLSVLVMHQLAVNHRVAVAATHEINASHHQTAGLIHQELLDGQFPAPQDGLRVTVPVNVEPCWPGCADHESGVLSCVLALTFLMLTWLLRPPRARYQVVPARLAPVADLLQAKIRRTAPSLAELSLRRT